MMNDQLQQRIAKKPNDVSLWDLVANNLIPDGNINLNGKVDDLTYQNALREYYQNINNNNNVRRTRIANIHRLTRRRRYLSEENENSFDNSTNDRFQNNNQRDNQTNNHIIRPSSSSHNYELNNQNSNNHIIRPSTASHINQLRLLKEAINENRQLQEKENCCICLTIPVTHVFIPCYHLCTCINCSSKINKCPKCRTNIRERHRVWF